MFTGIVEELGKIVGLDLLADSARLTIHGPLVAGACRGNSIAVNGVCLTVTAAGGRPFTADVMGETLARSGLGSLVPGAPVNLERPVQVGGRLDGHIVQGHVDGTGVISGRSRATNWAGAADLDPRHAFPLYRRKRIGCRRRRQPDRVGSEPAPLHARGRPRLACPGPTPESTAVTAR